MQKLQKLRKTELGRIPEKWKMVTVEQVTPIRKQGTIKIGPFGSSLKKNELYTTGDILTLWIENILDNELNLYSKKYITAKKYEELKSFTVKPLDIVITMMGTIGRVAIIPDDIGTAIISSHLLKITLDRSKCLPEFLRYYLLSTLIQNQIKKESRGIVMQGLNTRIVKSLVIHLPPLDEQQKIASILSKIDGLIEKTEQTVKQTQRLKKGLMQSVLVKGIGHQRYKKVRFGSLFLEYKIPDKWQVRTLEQCVRSDVPITYGIVQAGPNVLGGVPYIRTGDMSGDRLSKDAMLRTSEEIASSSPRSSVKAGEIVCALRGIVGKVLEVPKELEGANLTQGTARISPGQDIHPRYLLWALRSEYARRQFEVFSKGTTLIEITLARLRAIRVALPADMKEQTEIATIFDQLELLIGLTQRDKQKLVTIKKGLMQQLLTGKIRVQV